MMNERIQRMAISLSFVIDIPGSLTCSVEYDPELSRRRASSSAVEFEPDMANVATVV